MKISAIIEELVQIKAEHGDIEGQLQNWPSPGELVIEYPSFFIVAEEYENGEIICNLRAWPY